MQLFKNLFKSSKTGATIPEHEEAYASSNLVSSALFTQYNPDDLITRKGYGIYKKMMTDEQVKAVVRFHRDAVTGRDWSFQDHPKLSDSENEKRREVLTGIIKRVPGSFKTKLDMVMSSLYTGFSLTEKTFDLVDIDGMLWTGIKSLKLKPFDSFYFNLDEYGDLKSLEQQYLGDRNILDIKKFIHHVQNADVHEYYGQSELREAYRAWWSKDTTLLLQNIWLERSAAGFAWARPIGGKSITVKSPDYTNLVSILRNIRSNSALLLPKDVELNIEHPTDTQAFERAVQGHDKAISKALLMPNLLGLSEQGPNGSRSLGDTQLEAFLWVLDAEAKNLEEVINEQLFEDLAQYNFPDGLFPPFVLHELSNDKVMEVLDKWTKLVTGNAVKPNSQDEAHIRQQLKFPVVDPDDEDESTPVDPATALSGIQVTSMMEVIDRVANERIPRDTGLQILINSFPINLVQAESIMGDVGNGFEPKAKPQPGAPKVPAVDGEGNELPEDELDENGERRTPEEEDEETIIGQSRKRIEAKLAAAQNRVAFAVIEAKSTDIQEESVEALSSVITAATIPLVESIPEDIAATDISTVKFESKDVSKIRQTSKAMLGSSWTLGMKHAKDEVSKAKGEIMAASFARLDEDAAAFFDQKSFTMAGKLTADMLAIVQNTLSQSIKESMSRRDTIDSIYEQFAEQGFITPEDAESQMEGILQAKEAATARLNTVVRTNSFEAINEARYSYFTDPELSNFVEALEYTSILDNRTSSICRHLDGQVHAAEGDVWDGPWRPPNHFNALSEGTRIRTARGCIPIEHVRVGDYALTHTGRYKKVYAVMGKQNDTSRIRRIEIATGRCLLITDEHPILTSEGWKRADEIQVGDQVFQHIDQRSEVLGAGVAATKQRVLIDASNRESSFDEPLIAYDVQSATAGVSSAIQFDIDGTIDNNIEDIATDGNLGPVIETERVHQGRESSLVYRRVPAVCLRSRLSRLNPVAGLFHRVVGFHVSGMLLAKFKRCLGLLCSPVIFAARRVPSSHVQFGSLALGSKFNTVPLACIHQGSLPTSDLTFDGASGHPVLKMLFSNQFFNRFGVGKINHWGVTTITSIVEVNYSKKVYNLAVETDESYVADDVVVHNCRSLLIPITEFDKWSEDDDPEMMPAPGFGGK